MLEDYLPQAINTGPWLTAYSLPALQQLDSSTKLVLPICSLGTPFKELEDLGDLVLPPLYYEALTPELKDKIVERIKFCFPRYNATPENSGSDPQLEIVEVPPREVRHRRGPAMLGFSVDTAVEEHGPHLPLATDTVQSYGVLQRLADDMRDLSLGPPVEYGQLTWGLPFGFSIDLTAPLLTEYVTGFTNAVLAAYQPQKLYVVDVHGSLVHREAIVAGLQQSQADQWSFRWLHEPLVKFAARRQDQHAGGVETALVEVVNVQLVDLAWWPRRIGDIADGEMDLRTANNLTPDLEKFIEYVESRSLNGVVGRIENYHKINSDLMFDLMMDVAREDVETLRGK